MNSQVKDLANAMMIEFEADKTFNHLKENWFNSTSPCVQPEERGEGAQLKFLGMFVCTSLYIHTCVCMISSLYACRMCGSNLKMVYALCGGVT